MCTCKIHAMMSWNDFILGVEWPWNVNIHWTNIYFSTYSLRLFSCVFKFWFWSSNMGSSITNRCSPEWLTWLWWHFKFVIINKFEQGFFVSLFSLLLLNFRVWDYFQLTVEIVTLYSAAWMILYPLECALWPLIMIGAT